MNIAQYSNRRLVFIDDDNGTFRNIVDECSSCQYISGATALDEFIEELKPELNARLEEPGRQHEQLFIVISEFNDFFDMITNEQAAFMRKVFQYIDAPQYGIYFISQMSNLASTIKYCADRIQREDREAEERAATLKSGH